MTPTEQAPKWTGRDAAQAYLNDPRHTDDGSFPRPSTRSIMDEHFDRALSAPDEDWLADVIDDSMDMNWTGRVGACAIIRAWHEHLSHLKETSND